MANIIIFTTDPTVDNLQLYLKKRGHGTLLVTPPPYPVRETELDIRQMVQCGAYAIVDLDNDRDGNYNPLKELRDLLPPMERIVFYAHYPPDAARLHLYDHGVGEHQVVEKQEVAIDVAVLLRALGLS